MGVFCGAGLLLHLRPTMKFEILTGNCLELMRAMDDDSVDCVIADPPYSGFGLKGNAAEYWESFQPYFEEIVRVCRKVATISPSSQEQFESTKLSRRRFSWARHRRAWRDECDCSEASRAPCAGLPTRHPDDTASTAEIAADASVPECWPRYRRSAVHHLPAPEPPRGSARARS